MRLCFFLAASAVEISEVEAQAETVARVRKPGLLSRVSLPASGFQLRPRPVHTARIRAGDAAIMRAPTVLARAPETAAGAVGGPVPGDHGADRSSEEEDWDTVDTRQVLDALLATGHATGHATAEDEMPASWYRADSWRDWAQDSIVRRDSTPAEAGPAGFPEPAVLSPEEKEAKVELDKALADAHLKDVEERDRLQESSAAQALAEKKEKASRKEQAKAKKKALAERKTKKLQAWAAETLDVLQDAEPVAEGIGELAQAKQKGARRRSQAEKVLEHARRKQEKAASGAKVSAVTASATAEDLTRERVAKLRARRSKARRAVSLEEGKAAVEAALEQENAAAEHFREENPLEQLREEPKANPEQLSRPRAHSVAEAFALAKSFSPDPAGKSTTAQRGWNARTAPTARSSAPAPAAQNWDGHVGENWAGSGLRLSRAKKKRDEQPVEDAENLKEFKPEEDPQTLKKVDAVAREIFNGSKTDNYPTHGTGQDSLRWYLKKIGQVPLLQPHEAAELSESVQTMMRWMEAKEELSTDLERPCTDQEFADRLGLPGGVAELEQSLERMQADKDHLISANLRLVVSIAKRYNGFSQLTMQELIQEGTLGLVKAAEKFDHTRGNRFSTMATWWIRQAITRGLADHSRTIRLPVHMHDAVNKYRKVKRELERDLNRTPRQEEIAEAMGLSLDKIHHIECTSATRTVSMETPIGRQKGKGDPSSTTLEVLLPDHSRPSLAENCEQEMLRSDLTRLMQETLTEREAFVLTHRFGMSEDGRAKTLQEIGEMLDVTRERVRQIENRALQKLRNPKNSRRIADYAGPDATSAAPEDRSPQHGVVAR